MSEPFLGEVKMLSFYYAPRGWALCNGQLLPINQNQALFSLLGTNYGGNGQTTFALPDLRGRTPIHFNVNHPLGQSGGASSHTLTAGEVPQHSHEVGQNATTADAECIAPAGSLPAVGNLETYARSGALVPMAAALTTGMAGGGQAHPNMQPYLTINFVIALAGVYPTRP